jgi:2-C-methyl-D-erythritol 2,4-cyclodiphosphate synthase
MGLCLDEARKLEWRAQGKKETRTYSKVRRSQCGSTLLCPLAPMLAPRSMSSQGKQRVIDCCCRSSDDASVSNGDFRIGHGFDVHRFRRGRKLILGGVEIPYRMGLAGHSDADVLWHAVINALLGAMSEGDIGLHFPDTDPRYKGIASTKMLQKVLRLMHQRGFKLINVDVTLIAQQPRLAPYYAAMRKAMARRFRIAENRISIKATTTEKLGWAGKGKGMAATAVVLLCTA